MRNKYGLSLTHAYKRNDNGTFMFILLAWCFNPTEGMGMTILNIGINIGWNKQGGDNE
jgi:hypothetical protein